MSLNFVVGMVFFRPCGRGSFVHASKDGVRTLCGREVSLIWTPVDGRDFKSEPCPNCKAAMTRVFRKGKQATLPFFDEVGGSRGSFLVVKQCTKHVLDLLFGHGESPCFKRCNSLGSVDVDRAGSVSSLLHVGGFYG